MYWTELMRNILKSEMGRKIIREVAPVYEDAYVALWLFEVIGEALSDVEFWTDEFKKQVVPQTATWSLPMWESRYGINIDKSLSDEQRQRQIVLKRSSGHSPMNVKRLEKIASMAAGGECRIEEYTGPNRFTLHFMNIPGTVNVQRVRRAVNEAKQAHLIYKVDDRTEMEFDNTDLEQIILNRIRFHTGILFWRYYCFDGSWNLDGSLLLGQTRIYSLSASVKFISQIKSKDIEEIGNVTVTNNSKDYWFFDGSVNLDGSRLLNSYYRQEAIE
ncbi:MAG: DUF2313 domain-containing protein [Firmicutes bacterium]|nr:DUF2313 domain-containing protein [Bacillota bacterium]